MLNHPPMLITAVAALAVGLSACAGGSGVAAKSSSATGASTPTITPTTTSPTTPLAGTRTTVEVRAALLALDDLPSGFAIEPAGASGDAGAAKSADPKCGALVKLMNAKKAPGSKASASASLSGGQDGPFIDESIDALASADAVAALQTSFKTAVAACRQLTVSIPGQGSSTMKVVEVSAPKFGDHTLAARLTASGGPLDGLEITQVIAGVQDVVLSITFVAAFPEDVDGGTEAAVAKAEDVLGGASPGA
ncbi:MAG: hypothetical protein HHJ11_08930 [Phycicoccus sp.]|nr:hypothetical protein [Phycicoccus sp.]NMM35872.1 hypothetical protein [Phycicoccus sp.]